MTSRARTRTATSASSADQDVIIRGGENIPVAEVENLIYRHPQVAECAVVAIPDARLGERPCVYVVAKEGAKLDLADLTRFLAKEGMAKTYWPERLELVGEMPRTPSGKIQKFKLREQRRSSPPEHRKPPDGTLLPAGRVAAARALTQGMNSGSFKREHRFIP